MDRTYVQSIIEGVREFYGTLRMPLLAQLAKIHGLSVRDLAAIWGISKSHASDILSHKKVPDLELAFRIARYFEVTVDDLFGMRFDDDGSRRPLVMIGPDRKLIQLSHNNRKHSALWLAGDEVDKIREEHRLNSVKVEDAPA